MPIPSHPPADESALDNPVWSSLVTRHAHLAQGNGLARRYPFDFSPLAGVPDVAPANVAALPALAEVEDGIAFVASVAPVLPSTWEPLYESRLVQFIRRDATPLPESGATIEILIAADVDDMLALVELTHPGPFRRRTIELGTFVGVRDQGRLMAMAGERMWIGDFREVSGVCTHPDAQGRGLARALMTRVINGMVRAGQTPFLHVERANAPAIALYRSLGFVERAEFPLLYAKRVR